MLEAVSELWPEIQARGVRAMWIFGSHARGDAGTDSDLDLLVDFVSPPDFDTFMGLKLHLEDRFGTRVDLLSRSACPPRFLKVIESELHRVT
jgi:uncharacterized protein